jgi:NOL1/NOP2/fmu family ribosome biogenesis protein
MNQTKAFVDFLEERFGIEKSAFSGFSFHETPDKIYVMSGDIPQKDLNNLRIVQTGIVAGRIFDKGDKFKPTTNLLQIFGRFANKSIVELSEKEKEDFVRGLDIENKIAEGVENGYVIVKFGKDVLGCGIYVNGQIKNQIPKSRRLALR